MTADSGPAGYTEEIGAQAFQVVVDALVAMRDAIGDTDHINMACRYLQDTGRAGDMLSMVAALQDFRRMLGVAEAYVALECGRALRSGELEKAGQLPDGRPYEVRRAADRKGWDHEAWQAAARAKVLEPVAGHTVVDADTGEPVDVWAIATQVQKVHGAGPPRTGVLKDLGLDPADYCTQTPGPWSVNVLTNDMKVETTHE